MIPIPVPVQILRKLGDSEVKSLEIPTKSGNPDSETPVLQVRS